MISYGMVGYHRVGQGMVSNGRVSYGRVAHTEVSINLVSRNENFTRALRIYCSFLPPGGIMVLLFFSQIIQPNYHPQVDFNFELKLFGGTFGD